MDTNKKFDRGVGFTYFGTFRDMINRIEKLKGIETAYKVQCAIINYGLDGQKPDEETMLYLSEPILNAIDISQKRRSIGVSGEDLEMSRSIILYYRDHPDASQNSIAKALGVSKGKVSKTLIKYKDGGYDGVLDFDGPVSIYNINNNNNSNNNSNSSDRDRDRPMDHSSGSLTLPSCFAGDAADAAKQYEEDDEFEEIITELTEEEKILYANFLK